MTIHLATTSLPRGPLCGNGRDGDSTITASNDDPFHDRVDCPTCHGLLNLVTREFCNTVSTDPGPLPARCSRPPHYDGDHDWVPGPDVRRHADLANQSIAISIRKPQNAEEYAASALREAAIHREAEEARHADVHGEEPVGVGTPSGMLPARTPGAALRDAGEGSGGCGDPDEAARASESILGRPSIGRWVC